MKTIKQILMDRDEMSEKEADQLIADAKADFEDRVINPDGCGDPHEICKDWFGLEPDYLIEFF